MAKSQIIDGGYRWAVASRTLAAVGRCRSVESDDMFT